MGDSCSGDGVCQTTRWPFLARSAVALVVTVLAAIVVVRAVLLMLQPRVLQLKIAPSDVYVQRYGVGGNSYYVFRFYLEAANPSDRAFVYYSSISVQMDDKNGDLVAKFNLTPSSISLSPQEQQQYVVQGSAWHADVSPTIDEQLFARNDQKIDLVVMRLCGLIKENEEGATTPTRPSGAYNCQPLSIVNQKLTAPSSNNHKENCVPSVL